MDPYTALFRWNLWGQWQIPVSYPRTITEDIVRYTDTPEIMALIGPRRAGKSTILYQVMAALLENGVDPKAILHINLEEPEFTPLLNDSFLDKLYDVYRAKVYPKGKAYIFLDEIQNIPQWERWVRARNDTEDIKIWITGSSSALLSRELASVLTGRNFTFNIYPLGFAEVLRFKNIPLPPKPWPNTPPAEIKHALIEYLEWGGFPRIVLAQDDIEREKLLKRYFDEIILKDIVLRYQIRDVQALRSIAIHLLTNTASLLSYKRLSDIFQVSVDLVESYVQYLHEAFVIDTLHIYRLKAAERIRNPLKIHAYDLGLRKVVSLSTSPDYGKLVETIVHNHLLSLEQDGLFYWRGVGEIDFVTQKGIATDKLIQVAYGNLDEVKTLTRELKPLQEGLKQYPNAMPYLITWEWPKRLESDIVHGIKILPLWHFLLP